MALRNLLGDLALETTQLAIRNLISDEQIPRLQAILDSTVPLESGLASLLAELENQQVDGLTNAQLRAADVNVADSGERNYLSETADLTTAGDHTIITPASGNRIIVHWIYAINDPVAATSTKMKARFGANAPYYNLWAIAKRQRWEGGVDEPLIINLSAAGDVAVTVIYEEVT